MCDKLVLPRPSIVPLVITPPGSPEDNTSASGERVFQDEEIRAKERESWARYVKRGRSLSFGNERPKVDAPIIGNAKARAEDFEKRRRSSSRWRPRHGTSQSAEVRPSFLHVDSNDTVGVRKSFGFVKVTPSRLSDPFRAYPHPDDPFRAEPYLKHAHTQSSPDLTPIPRPKAVRISDPTQVVIISPEPPRPPPNFSKPLPNLPREASSSAIPETPRAARSFLIQQHMKDRTRRAFQSPSSGPPRLSTSSMASNGAIERKVTSPRDTARSCELSSPREATPPPPFRSVSKPASQSGPPLLAPPIIRADTSTSGKTVFTDASEGWNRSGVNTPISPAEDEISDRFKGLFFRTPQEGSSLPTNRAARQLFPSLDPETPTGLGFDLARDSSASGTSDPETIEITTPIYPDTVFERSSSRLASSYNSSSRSVRSAAQAVTGELDAHASLISEFRLSPAPIRQPTLIATPPQAVNAGVGERREVENTDHLETPESVQQRYSAVPSFVHDFPSPPMSDGETPHASAFGQIVTGPPGAGKSTYCHGMHQFLTALGRKVHVVNLDPAIDTPPYPCSINITEIITLDSVMEEYQLGPNGAMIYVAEYLEENMDWLIGRLDGLNGDYVIFDTPGQVELWTNHESLRRVLERLTKIDYRLVAVHLSDSHYITDASKFISVSLLALRAMMSLELPHVNVLSKIDLLSSYGELPFDLRYYAECRDLDYLLDKLESEPGMGKGRMPALNKAMVELVEEYGSVSFETLAVEDKKSMLRLLRVIDKSNGYIHLPGQKLPDDVPELDQLPGLDDLRDVDDVQERWGTPRVYN